MLKLIILIIVGLFALIVFAGLLIAGFMLFGSYLVEKTYEEDWDN